MQTLQEWSTSGDGRYKRTAALAYGILGRKYKTEALKSLREIADRVSKSPQRSFAVYDSIVNSLRIIFTYGNDDSAFYGLVLIALREWAQSQETPAISQIALLTFVLIAGSDGTQKNGDEWLTVLAYTHSHSRLRGVVVSLLARAITEQSTRSIAIDVLRAWCKHATDISNSERVVYTLIQLLWDNSSGFDRDRLLYYLHSWSTDRELGVFVRKVVNALTSPRN